MSRRPPFVPIGRQFFETRWLRPRTFSTEEAWIDCIQLARWSGGEHPTGVTLKRGQFAASYSWLAVRWGWSVKQVRLWISGAQLRADLRAEPRAQPGAQTPTVYSLVSYDTWNPTLGDEGTAGGTDKGTDGGTERGNNKKNTSKKTDPALDALVADGCAIWKAEMGGDLNFGRLKKLFKPLLADHPADTIMAHWRELFRRNQRATDKQFIRPETWASQFGLYAPPGILSVMQGGLSDEERYAFLVGEAQRGMDMADTAKYPDWPTYRQRYWNGEKPKVMRGSVRSAV